MKLHNIFGCSLLTLALLTGCGGGGSSSTDTPQSQTESTTVGIVSDSQIIGLRYISTNKDKTQTKKGVTNLKGEFEYFEGGTTEFYVGNIKIGSTKPEKFVAITTVTETEKEAENIARFLQTIDEDSNPDNGIQISSSVDEHAKKVSLKFDDTFDTNFDNVKTELFENVANIPETITVEQALNHANKSVRLASLKEFDLYKAIANEKNYRGGDYYNADALEKSQRKRIYLWIWEKILSKEMEIEDEWQFTKPEYDINKVEKVRNKIKKYLDYADAIISLISLRESTIDTFEKAGKRSISYNISKLSSLSVAGCDAVVKLYDANTSDTIELSNNNICKEYIKITNPTGDSNILSPIITTFATDILPDIVKLYKMNFLKMGLSGNIKTLVKYKFKSPDYKAVIISLLKIGNDFYGASWASDINEELTTRMVAREWLNIWFRSGFDQSYMNKLINNNSKKLTGRKEQIEAIALKWGSSGALCETYHFFNPFYKCTGIEHINYNYDKVADIINEKLSKSNALYRNVTSLTGSISDEKGDIGTVEFDWVKDGNLSNYTEVGGQPGETEGGSNGGGGSGGGNDGGRLEVDPTDGEF